MRIRLWVLALTFAAASWAEAVDYLAAVEAYADAMLADGRDTSGSQHSPLFAAALKRNPIALPNMEQRQELAAIPRERWGIRSHDRMLSGANPMHDQNLYQILYALTSITGEQHYGREADRTLGWFFENCQSPETGLMAWGEHIGWDFETETIIDKRQGTNHEFFRPWVLWNRSYELAAESAARFAHGLWEHQIADKEAGDFSRHAKYDRHEPGRNNQYPRHGGFFIATWAAAYEHTRDPTFLKAIETVVGFYERHRSRRSGAIPAEIGNERSQGRLLWPQSNLSLAIDLTAGAAKVPAKLADRMERLAGSVDDVNEEIPHRLSADGEGFVVLGDVHTLKATDVRDGGQRVYSHLWATGYGQSTDAAAANICLLRYQQTKRDHYRGLVLATADRYLGTDPNLEFPLYPGTMGDVLYALLGAHELTGRRAYLQRANELANRSIQLFLSDGSPIPQASSEHSHYESITRGDTLMMALLKLWVVQNRPELKLSLVWCDR